MSPLDVQCKRFVLSLLLFFCGMMNSNALGQEMGPRQFEIDEIIFDGNAAFKANELREIIVTKETPGAISKFFYNIFGETFGTKPQYFDGDLLFADIQRLKMFYQDHGYFGSMIRESLAYDTARARVTITFLIQENQPSKVDSLEYRGLSTVAPEIIQRIFEEPLLEKGMIYQKQRVLDEIDRILRILGNEGYPNARFDKENSFVSRYLSSNNVYLVVSFVPGRQLRFGNVSVNFDPPREDLTDDIVLRQLDFEPGEIYSKEKRIASERSLNRLGIFETARVEAVPPPQAETTGVVPVQIVARPRDKHELSPEMTVSDENNAFNLGFGIGYTNRNFFGDARSFNARLHLRTQSIQEWNFTNVFGGVGLRDTSVLGALELQFYLVQPYLFTRSLSGSWTFSLSAEKQKFYILPIIRNKMGLSNQFAAYTYGFLEWALERVSVEFLQDTASTHISLSRRREEERPQFNSILSLTLQRDKTNDIFSPSQGFFHSVTLEESGILPKLLKGLEPGLPFTQFYKISLLGRWYEDVTHTRYNIFAFKVKTGYQDKYGESKNDPAIRIPLNRRFFAGGSGSVRGWKSRDLGVMPDDELQFGGNFILEGNFEMRINYFRGFGKLWFINLDNFWVVYFLDAGNVWSDLNTFKTRDIAIAAGLGVRYETLFGPFRVDFGFRVYDPKEQAERQWIFQKRFFGDILANGVLHFGLGHAF